MIRDVRVTLAFVFGLIGGLLILTPPIAFFSYSYGYGYGFGGAFGAFLTALAVPSGILVILGTTLGFVRPQQGVTWGIVVIVFGAVSVISPAFGGFVIGMALSITGGALMVAVGASGPMSAAGGQRACLGCGMLVDRDFAHSPHCGHAMPPLA